MLPPFTAEGLLPPGDYPLTFDGLRESRLITGEGSASDNWDRSWRGKLVDNLQVLVEQLWRVGIEGIYVNGSFVEEKDHPNDIDGYFECPLGYLASGALQRDLNALDAYKIWDWHPASRRPDLNSAKQQLPMWHRYRVELYPHVPGLLSGIRDQFGYDLQFPSAFRLSRSAFRAKGIVQIMQAHRDVDAGPGGNEE